MGSSDGDESMLTEEMVMGMTMAERILAFQRKHTPRSKQPPHLPHELQRVSIDKLPAAVEELLQETPLGFRESVIEQLVLAVKSSDEDTKSRAWIALVTLGRAAILPIGELLLQKNQDREYRLRLIRLLGEIGEKHREAMGPLMHVLSTVKVPEVLGAAQVPLMRMQAGAPSDRRYA